MFKFLIFILTFLLSSYASANTDSNNIKPPSNKEFKAFINQLKIEFKKQYNFSDAFLDKAFKNAEFLEDSIKLDRKQPEFSGSFYSYTRNTLSKKRIQEGRNYLKAHKVMFAKVYDKYGIPPEVIVALWGIETDYGRITGKFNAISTLTTLSYDGRRSSFFKKELLTLLILIDQGSFDTNVKSSWAGALGKSQFMPTTYYAYAVDFNKNGKRNLWDENSDLFPSMGNFLKILGYKKTEPWGLEIKLPKKFDYTLTGLDTQKPLQEWKSMGIKIIGDKPLPIPTASNSYESSIILPAGSEGTAFLVFRNFRVFLKWNNSQYFALSVGLLSDFIASRYEPESLVIPEYPAISVETIIKVQTVLKEQGFYNGNVDGALGPQTKYAVMYYQKKNKLKPDGYLSPFMIESILKSKVK